MIGRIIKALGVLKRLVRGAPKAFGRLLKRLLLGGVRLLVRVFRLLFIDGPRWLVTNAVRLLVRAYRSLIQILRTLFVDGPRWLVKNSKRLLLNALYRIISAPRGLIIAILDILTGGLKRVFWKRGMRKGATFQAGEPVIPEEPPAVLDSYDVNAPYASIAIEDRHPPRYVVKEPALTAGEQELLAEIKTRLYESLDVRFDSNDSAVDYLKNAVAATTSDFHIKLSPEDTEKIMYYVVRDLVGYGKLDAILKDPRVEDISADGPDVPIFIYHRSYGSIESSVVFREQELDAMIYKLAQRSGRHISLSRPLLDASLPTKDRLQLSIGTEITTRGSTFTIRKFRETPFTPMDLINFGTFSVEIAAYFWMAVEHGFNILISGGTASGKTSILNALAMFIPANAKIVTLEDTREINILHQNWIPAVTRESGSQNPIEMFDLLRSALRQRPEYLLVGEVRGREAYTLFQAMATGHICISTVHADSVEAIVRRLTKPPIDVPLMLLDALDVVSLQAMVKVGDRRVRRCTAVVEITGVDFDNETLRTNEVFTWKPDEFTFSGESRLFTEMMSKLSLTEQQLSEEFARRVEILRLLQERRDYDFHKLSELFFEYNLDPETVYQKVKEGAL